jgi:hypothetical protein
MFVLFTSFMLTGKDSNYFAFSAQIIEHVEFSAKVIRSELTSLPAVLPLMAGQGVTPTHQVDDC